MLGGTRAGSRRDHKSISVRGGEPSHRVSFTQNAICAGVGWGTRPLQVQRLGLWRRSSSTCGVEALGSMTIGHIVEELNSAGMTMPNGIADS